MNWSMAALATLVALMVIAAGLQVYAVRLRNTPQRAPDVAANLSSQESELRSEISALRARLAMADPSSPAPPDAPDRGAPPALPTIWVTYKPKSQASPREMEALVFEKEERDPAIKSIRLAPLKWEVARPISLHNVMGPLRAQPVECKFTAFEQTGNAQILYELPELLRHMMKNLGGDAQPSLKVYYEDFNGSWFCRNFVLSIDPYDRIAMDPVGSVQRCEPPPPEKS